MRLTRFTFPYILSLILFTVACTSTKGQINTATSQDSPPVKHVEVYEIYPDDEKGFLVEKRFYNENGQLTRFHAYDFYGSGEIEDSVSYSYNEKGQKIEQFTSGSQTTTTYAYNEQGKLKEESWSRPNGQGAKSIYSYNSSGDVVEIKYYDADGKHDYSRVYELGYDRKGRMISEKKWEKYTDGSADLLQYHYEFEYNSDDSVLVRERLDAEGNVDRKVEYEYDKAGRLISEVETALSKGKEKQKEKTVYHLNELGQVIKDESISIFDGKERLNYTNSYKYDEYGHCIWSMYKHAEENDARGERSVYTYY